MPYKASEPRQRAGELTAVWVPDAAHEAVHDLVRSRDAAVRDIRRKGSVQRLGDADGSDTTGWAVAGREIIDGAVLQLFEHTLGSGLRWAEAA